MEKLIPSFSSMDELVFENRNMAYGAYVLRKDFNRNISKGVAVAVGVFLLAVGVPEILKAFEEPVVEVDKPKTIICTIPLPPTYAEVPPPPRVNITPPPPKARSLAHVVPNLTDREIEETPFPTQEEIKRAPVLGTETLDSDETYAPSLDDEIIISDGGVTPQKKEEEIFRRVEQMPYFANLAEFLSKNLRYPEAAVRQQIEGKVYLSFVVDTDGAIKDITVLKGISKECDEEAVRVISKMPKWRPGKQSGNPVKVRYSLPINFTLSR